MYIIMFDFLDNVKKNIDNNVPQLELYINIITILMLCALVYLLCLLLISYNNNEDNNKVFNYVKIIGFVMLIMFYVKNMSRINLFMRSQWVSLDNKQKKFFIILVSTILINLGIQSYRNHIFKNNSTKPLHINMLIILTGIILSSTVSKTIDSVINLRDYVRNNRKNQVYNKLNRELSYAKLNEIKMYVEKDV